jgi:ribose transport system substrate-binding protein
MSRRLSRRTLIWAIAVIIAAVPMPGCGGDDDDSGGGGGGGGGDYTVGVSLASPTIPLYVSMADGIRAKARELGVDVKFTDANEDPVQQLDDVQDLIAQNVDGILISPIDEEAAIPAYEDAQASDITIMSIARNTDPEVEDSFIGAPWGKFGRQIADWTCDEARGRGEIAMIKGPAGASFVTDMEEAYKGYMSSECPGMEIVFEGNSNMLTPDEGVSLAQDALSANPELDVIYANNDDLADGAITALQETGGAEDVIITGFDGTPTGVKNIRQGAQSMTIALRPYRWGQLGLETMLKSLDGEDVPPLVEISTLLIDQDNVDQITAADIR